jgi:hypothetical protein
VRGSGLAPGLWWVPGLRPTTPAPSWGRADGEGAGTRRLRTDRAGADAGT